MFGRHLRNAREAAGLTQEDLADRADLHRTYISLLERDQRSPTLDVVFALAKAMGTSASDLVAKTEKDRLKR
jgi:transcriptional regulator with XRE-family HTH domain